MRYQETWVRGTRPEPFQRECASRYEPIEAFLNQYDRPFSVFDFGANCGYFAFRIAEDFPHATVIAVDDRRDLTALAKENGLGNVAVLRCRLSAGDLSKLARCEAFDVVLALNVLHHMADGSAALAALERLGSHLIVETPGPGDDGAAYPERHAGIREGLKGAEKLADTDSHVSDGVKRGLFHRRGAAAKRLTLQTVDAVERQAPKTGAVVEMGFDKASIAYDRGERRAFVPGMNLWNWRLLGGTWPSLTDIERRMRRAVAGMDHRDIRPWNFILSGDGLHAIDADHGKPVRPERNVDTCLDILKRGAFP